MFQQAETGRYHFCDLTRHFKIWLAPNPNKPFGSEANEYRIMDFLRSNPKAHLFIIIDKSLFSPLGEKRFYRFWNMFKHPEFKDAYNRLHFVDLTDIERACIRPTDLELMKIVKNEIRMKYPGWTAIASDLLRYMTPCRLLGNVYSDFDLNITLLMQESCYLPSTFACIVDKVDFPFSPLANYRFRNDFLIFIDPENNAFLSYIQKMLVAKYHSNLTQRTAGTHHQTSYCNVATGECIKLPNCTTLDFVVHTTGPMILQEILYFAYYLEKVSTPTMEKPTPPNLAFLRDFFESCHHRLSARRFFPQNSIKGNYSKEFKILSEKNQSGSDLSWISIEEVRTSKPINDPLFKKLNLHSDAREMLKMTFFQMRMAAYKLSFWWEKHRKITGEETAHPSLPRSSS